MPQTQILTYQKENGQVPLLSWFLDSEIHDNVSRRKCVAMISLLASYGYDLRRPHADFLEDGIYELRIRTSQKNYRILYSFVGKNVVLLTHGIVKESRVPTQEIEAALEMKREFEKDQETHTFRGEVPWM